MQAWIRWTTTGFAYIEGNDYKTQFPAVNAYVTLFLQVIDE